MIQTRKRCEKMFNLIKTPCFVDRRCDRVMAQKDVVSFLREKLSAFGIRKNSRGSDAVERSAEGRSPSNPW
jgi:hypothetical protein